MQTKTITLTATFLPGEWDSQEEAVATAIRLLTDRGYFLDASAEVGE